MVRGPQFEKRWCGRKGCWEHDLTSCLLKQEDGPLFLSKRTPKKNADKDGKVKQRDVNKNVGWQLVSADVFSKVCS